MVRLLKLHSHSNFQVHSTVLLTIVTRVIHFLNFVSSYLGLYAALVSTNAMGFTLYSWGKRVRTSLICILGFRPKRVELVLCWGRGCRPAGFPLARSFPETGSPSMWITHSCPLTAPQRHTERPRTGSRRHFRTQTYMYRSLPSLPLGDWDKPDHQLTVPFRFWLLPGHHEIGQDIWIKENEKEKVGLVEGLQREEKIR